jgi:hypothetical protein
MDKIADTNTLRYDCCSSLSNRLSPLKFGVYVKLVSGVNFLSCVLLTLKFCEILELYVQTHAIKGVEIMSHSFLN